MIRARLAVLPMLLAALAGCGTLEEANKNIADRESEASLLVDKAKKPAPTIKGGQVRVNDGIWMGSRSRVIPNGDPLPPSALRPGAVVLNSMGTPLEMREIIAEVTSQTGLKVVIEEAIGGGAGAARAPGMDSTGRMLGSVPSPMPMGSLTGGNGGGMALAWNGPLPGLMDAVSTFFNYQWEYRSGLIRLYQQDVRTFTLAALPSVSTVRAGVNTTGTSQSAGNSGGNTAGTTSGAMIQDISNESQLKIWDNIKETVEAMLPAGSKVSMSPATGTLTVIAPTATMRRVASYIEEQNARITRQVTVSVKVLRIELSDSFNLGLDMGLVLNQLSGQYQINLAGPTPSVTDNAASFTVKSVLNTMTDKGQWATSTDATRAVINALQAAGNVGLLTESSVTTLNGQAAPVSVSRQQSYVASTTTSVSGSSSTTQTAITPGTIITGFNMQVLPRILDDGQVLLQYGLSLSDLRDLTEFTSGTSTVQLPDVNVRSFMQQAMLRSGDVLVLAGYQSLQDVTDDRGLPGLGKLFGGSSTASKTKTVLVILLTPDVFRQG